MSNFVEDPLAVTATWWQMFSPPAQVPRLLLEGVRVERAGGMTSEYVRFLDHPRRSGGRDLVLDRPAGMGPATRGPGT